MYWACWAFYIISASLLYAEHWKIVNVFILTFESHETQSNYIIDSFKKDFQQLDKECEMIINDKKIHVCAFIIIFLEDML